MGTARVLGDVAANRADFLAGGVGGVVQAVLRHVRREVEVDHPRLDDGHPVHGVDLQDAGHAGEGKHDAAVLGDGAAAEAGPSAPRDDRDAVACGYLHAGGDLVGVPGDHDGQRRGLVDRPIILEDDQVLGGVEHVVVADHRLQLLGHRVLDGHVAPLQLVRGSW